MTAHDALVLADDVDILVSADGDKILLPDDEPSALEQAVARNIAAVIPDKTTIQFGIGGLSVAVARALSGHRDLVSIPASFQMHLSTWSKRAS